MPLLNFWCQGEELEERAYNEASDLLTLCSPALSWANTRQKRVGWAWFVTWQDLVSLKNGSTTSD